MGELLNGITVVGIANYNLGRNPRRMRNKKQPLEIFIEEVNRVIRIHKFGISPVIHFEATTIPWFGKVGIWLLGKAGGRLRLQYPVVK